MLQQRNPKTRPVTMVILTEKRQKEKTIIHTQPWHHDMNKAKDNKLMDDGDER